MACPYDVVVVIIPVLTLHRPRGKSLLASGVYNIKGKRLVGAIQPVIIVRSQRKGVLLCAAHSKVKVIADVESAVQVFGVIKWGVGCLK